MSLLQFLRILAARRAILLAALVSCFLVALAVSQILPPRYQGHARIMLDIVKPDPVTGQLIGTQFVRAYTRTQIELIQDYRTSGRVVDQLGWASDPRNISQFADETAGQPSELRRLLAQQISEGTKAELLEGSNILEITYTASTPQAAKQVAELIRAAYIEEGLRFRRESASRTADWYREQADRALRLLTAAEAARTQFAKENGIVLQPDNTDLESAKLAALSSQSAAAEAAPAMGGMAMPAANPAAMQLEVLDQQIAQAATTLGPNHPAFQSLQRQRSALAANAARGGGGMRMPSGPNVAQIERAYEEQKGRVISQRDKIDRINQMQRDIDLKRDQYLRSAQRAADLRLEADVGETGLTPLGDATALDSPSFPNMPLIVLGSIAFGLGLGICLSLIVEFLGRRVRSEDDLEYATAAPVFAIIGDRRKPGGWVRRILRMIDRRARTRTGDLVEADA